MEIKVKIMLGNQIIPLGFDEAKDFAALVVTELGPKWNKQESTELTIKLQPED